MPMPSTFINIYPIKSYKDIPDIVSLNPPNHQHNLLEYAHTNALSFDITIWKSSSEKDGSI